MSTTFTSTTSTPPPRSSDHANLAATGQEGLQTSPKAMESDHVELNSMRAHSGQAPHTQDVMQLARLGDIVGLQALHDAGKLDPNYKDEEGITPLHWAAINNRYALCRYLIELGADVNAKGGESVATPAMWAAQRCHYYIVNLLLQHGADPLLTDVQGYNIMHLATFDGNMFLLILLLHQNIPVDATDPQGHTCLMWAAYKGYAPCVDLFLRWGADVHAADESGFTALHWALVKGSQACIQKLIEYGSDRFAETSTGKTPATVASEMKSARAWRRALADCGYREDATPRSHIGASSIRSKSVLTKFYFLWPFFLVWCVLMILSHMVVYAAVPIAALVGYCLQWLAVQVLQFAPPEMKHIHRTPFLAGVFAGMCFWVGVRWCTTILPSTFWLDPFTNIFFGTCYALCTYFYFCSVVFDPGYVPKLAGLAQQKAAIEELLGIWRFDAENYCVLCMVRKPLRSKHCKKCGRCIAKHDHHCPWVYNCIGVNNHRHFLFYLFFLEIGVLTLIRLTSIYLESLPELPNPDCNILSEVLCKTYSKDPYTIILTALTGLQLIWVTMLIFVQMVQVSRAQTTFENMRGNVHHIPHGAPEAITSALTAGTTSLEGAQLTPAGMGPDPALSDGPAHHHHHHHQGFLAQWKRILGLDTFMATAQAGLGGAPVRRDRNPFSRGIITNCKDFWCDGTPVFRSRPTGAAALGREVVDYTKLYEAPPRRPPRMTASNQSSSAYERVATEDTV